jgi:hypothetical protein
MEITKRAEDMTDDELATIAAQGLPKAKAEQLAASSSWNGGDNTTH